MKWRKIKKQFKKNKHQYKGWNMVVQPLQGMDIPLSIKDVYISKGGGKNIKYQFVLEPIQQPVSIPQEEPKGYYSNTGWSTSFDMKLETPTNELKKLMDL